MSSTRVRILDTAVGLVEAQPATVPSMSEVARATGISRQALYLHFPDRSALLLALVEHVDARSADQTSRIASPCQTQGKSGFCAGYSKVGRSHTASRNGSPVHSGFGSC